MSLRGCAYRRQRNRRDYLRTLYRLSSKAPRDRDGRLEDDGNTPFARARGYVHVCASGL